MTDLALEWQDDLVVGPSGDLNMVDGGDMTRQRIERRLFTAVQGYIWHQEYGGGLPQRIGRVNRVADIAALCRAQIKLEASVAATPVPYITVTESASNMGLFVISIKYTDLATGAPIALQFEVPSSS